MQKHRRLILIGPPASGKGTQARFLSEHFSVPTLSTGALLRKEINSGSEIGQKAQDFMNNGKFVPDELVIEMVENWIDQLDEKAFLLDGYPRTLVQAQALKKYIDTHHGGIDCVVWMDVARQIIENRIKHRVECPACHYITQGVVGQSCPSCATSMTGRSDDALDKFVIRWADFENLTLPVTRFYENLELVVKISINSERPVEDVSSELLSKLEAFFASKE